jgi:transcriptional regulator with XRE-family HTH domain
MEHARPLEAQTVPAEKSAALTSLRLQRKLTVEEAAKKAALWPEQVEWLEEGRLYRFPGYEAAVTALLRYATALGIDHREARRLSGMPVEPPPPRQLGRWIAAGAAASSKVDTTVIARLRICPFVVRLLPAQRRFVSVWSWAITMHPSAVEAASAASTSSWIWLIVPPHCGC